MTQAVRGDRLEALCLLALLGLRQGEVLGLCWPDVDLENGQLEVRQALQRVRPARPGEEGEVGYRLGDPKTAESQRPVKLPPTAVSCLRAHRRRQMQERLAAARWENNWDLVFTTPQGAPLNGRVLLAGFQRKLGEAGLPKVRFHDLRPACSSLLQAKGISPRVVQDQLGHSDLAMTLRYTKVLPELAEAAAQRMEEVLGEAGEEEGGCLDGAAKE